MAGESERAEFEKWAGQHGWSLRYHDGKYYWAEAARAWKVWQVAYAAGRMAVQREAEEWSKRVNKRFIEMQNKLECEQ